MNVNRSKTLFLLTRTLELSLEIIGSFDNKNAEMLKNTDPLISHKITQIHPRYNSMSSMKVVHIICLLSIICLSVCGQGH